jgi:hypothetical protein
MLGIPKIILQTDCSSLVDLWKDGKEQMIIGAHIVKEMQDMCQLFQEVRLLYIGRDANNAAHRCGKEALSIVNFVCFDVILGFLSNVI